MQVSTFKLILFCLLHLIGWATCSSPNSLPPPVSALPESPLNPITREEYLLPLIQKIQAAEDAHTSGQPGQAVIESLRGALTDFKDKFGSHGHQEAIHALSSSLLKPQFKSTPNYVTQLGQLLYEAAKTVFGPTHLYSLTILRNFAANLQGESPKKSLQVNLVLANFLRAQLNSTSCTTTKSKCNKNQEAEIQLMLGTLDNMKMLYLNTFNWTESLSVSKEIYEIRHSRIDPLAEETVESLMKLVKLYSLAHTQILMAQQHTLFQVVQRIFTLSDLTFEETSRIVEAYEAAGHLTRSNPTHAFPVYLEFMTRKQGGKMTPGPLKYDEEVYEFLFVIMRLILSTASLNGRDPEHEMYRKKLLTMVKEAGDNFNFGSAALRPVVNDFVFGMDRPYAKAQHEDAIQRAEDLVKRAEIKFGKMNERTQGNAEIVASLYGHVGMVKEATEIRRIFELPPQENIETKVLKDEL